MSFDGRESLVGGTERRREKVILWGSKIHRHAHASSPTVPLHYSLALKCLKTELCLAVDAVDDGNDEEDDFDLLFSSF